MELKKFLKIGAFTNTLTPEIETLTLSKDSYLTIFCLLGLQQNCLKDSPCEHVRFKSKKSFQKESYL